MFYSKHKINKLLEYIILFVIYGSMYCVIEILYRGYTHYSMFFVGAICGIFIGLINEILSWNTPIIIQSIIGGSITLLIEFLSGCILNLWLGLNVWDYSNLKFNILGQICPQFFFLWCVLSVITIILDDYIRYFLFKEEKPKYKIL